MCLRVSAVTLGTGERSVHGLACATHATAGRAFGPRNKSLAVKRFTGFFAVGTGDADTEVAVGAAALHAPRGPDGESPDAPGTGAQQRLGRAGAGEPREDQPGRPTHQDSAVRPPRGEGLFRERRRDAGWEDQPHTLISTRLLEVVTGRAGPVPGGISGFLVWIGWSLRQGAQRRRSLEPCRVARGGVGALRPQWGEVELEGAWVPDRGPTWQPKCPGMASSQRGLRGARA